MLRISYSKQAHPPQGSVVLPDADSAADEGVHPFFLWTSVMLPYENSYDFHLGGQTKPQEQVDS